MVRELLEKRTHINTRKQVIFNIVSKQVIDDNANNTFSLTRVESA